ncbi:diguanylate cyclase [Xanthomonas oryzae pv. oryzae]|nr:diguanylate cyclase [Xanthomonas oryzae pv. oryzae]
MAAVAAGRDPTEPAPAARHPRSAQPGPYEVGAARPLQVTCSVGVSWFRVGDTAASLLARADEALYRAKRSGRNRIEPAEPESSVA